MAIGIYGGSFNPPHKEHINIIKKCLENGLEEVVVVPSHIPPHKNTSTNFCQRVDMLNIALLGIKNVYIDNIENLDNKIHYSFEILPKLKNKYKDIVFIIGGDSIIDLYKWKNPELVIKICPIWVINRGNRIEEFNNAINYWKSKGADIKIVDYKPIDVSSSYIRKCLALGFYGLIDEKVETYIKQNNLYRDYDEYIFKLHNLVEENTFFHSLRVAKYALYINHIHNLNLDDEKVLLAGLLHDCAKKLVYENNQDKEGVPIDALGLPVEHQFYGSIIARREFGIKDEEILNAIKYHTTGKANMSTLEKLIYSADLLEEGRVYDFIPPLRKIMEKDFEKGFIACIMQQYDYLKKKKPKSDIYYLTKEAANYYNREE